MRRIDDPDRPRHRARRRLGHRAAPHDAVHHRAGQRADAKGPPRLGLLEARLRAAQRHVHDVRRLSPAGVATAPVGAALLLPQERRAHAAAREPAGSLHAPLLRLLRLHRGHPARHHFARRRERQRRLLFLCVGPGAARRQRGARRLGHLRDGLQDDRRRRHDGAALRGSRREGAGERPRAKPADADRRLPNLLHAPAPHRGQHAVLHPRVPRVPRRGRHWLHLALPKRARLPEGKLDPLLAGLRLEALRRPLAKQR
mmetsp:Transcript_13801/g.44219  ORF Transcript_13801/g.44219 Transcript_13801/m.44219 type:complete len:257 (-) Transcript_13801:730-1500(-)